MNEAARAGSKPDDTGANRRPGRKPPSGGAGSGAGAGEPQDREGIRERVGRVADHQDGAVAEDAEDGLQEVCFVVGIEVCCGFVEEQDACSAEKFACEREAEAFPGGEFTDGFGEHGVELVRERADHGPGSGIVKRGKAGGIVRQVGTAEREVGAKRGGDELGERAKVANPAAQGTDIVVVKRVSVDQDRA